MEQSTAQSGAMMDQMMFNELSIHPLAKDKTESFHRVRQFIDTFNCGRKYAFNRIRFVDPFDSIQLYAGYSLNDFCNEHKTLGILLRGLSRYPFIDDDTEEENRYIANSFAVVRNDENQPCHGLAAAYLYNTLGIGFASGEEWSEIVHSLLIHGSEKQVASVYCMSSADHFQSDFFAGWLEQRKDIQLIECPLKPHEKSISLRNDHGKDDLLCFSNKLVQSPHVIRIINSLPFNPNEKNFIRKIKSNGYIEIVLTNTDMGLGVVVETTGNTYKETRAIADLLQEAYG
jgi:hypothetical protein